MVVKFGVGLDWLNDSEKIAFDVAENPELAESLLQVFDSQISGGKRYDLATIGRRLANATFYSTQYADNSASVIYGMDLTPLIMDESLDIKEYVLGYIDRFSKDVAEKLESFL